MASARGRPAPPGRPRNSQVRSASSYSLPRQQQDELSRSPLSSSDTIPANLDGTFTDHEDETGVRMTASATARGLGLNMSSEMASSPAHEIPLEDVEHALRDLTRDDLVLALKRAKEQMDILDTKLEAHVERSETLEAALGDYATQIGTLEEDKQGLEFALAHREERIDEVMQEQERMEQEIYRKAQVNERLRKQLDESERVRADTERRYAEQSLTSDKERQSFLDMEKLLQTQKAKAAATMERTQSANHQLARQNERLQQKVVHLQQRASPLRPKGPLAAEKVEESLDSSGPEDDRDSVTSSDPGSKAARSIDGEDRLPELQQELETLRSSQATLTATLQHLQTELRDIKAVNMDLRTQNETFVDLLHEKTINGELITESAMLNRRYSTIGEDSEFSSSEDTEATETETSEADDEDDVPDVPKKRNRGKSLRRDSNVQLHNDLASELETSDAPTTGRREVRHRERTRERSEMLSSNVEELQKEIWELRDANQALTLYVNKILDRIISREGYENVLAIDADHKRTLRGKASRHFRAGPSPGTSPEAKLATSPRATGNRVSGIGFLGLRRTDEEPLSPGSPTTPTASKAAHTHTKAKRVSGMDWRSFFPGVGGIGAASSTSPNPANDSIGAGIGEARKIRSSEEKEDKSDEEERERIRQQLLREGIVLPEHQLKSQPQQNKRASGIGTFFSRVIGTAEATTSTNDANTVKKGEQHPGPRLTTFDGQGRIAGRSPLGMGADTAPSEAGSNSESGSLTKADLRQRALELGGASNLTEAPARRSVLDGRRSGKRSAGGGSSSSASNSAALSPAASRTSDRSSRGASEAGDESYFYQSGRGETMSSSPGASPSLQASARVGSGGSTNAEAEAPGWRKALRRVSLIGSASAVTDSSKGQPE